MKLRSLLLLVIGALYLISVPWYRDANGDPSLLFGLPDWVAVALLCYVAVACLNAWAWSLADVRDELSGGVRDPAGEGSDDPGSAP